MNHHEHCSRITETATKELMGREGTQGGFSGQGMIHIPGITMPLRYLITLLGRSCNLNLTIVYL